MDFLLKFLGNPVVDLSISLLVTIVAAIVVYLLQQDRKNITCDVISNTPVLSIDDEVKGKAQVLYEGKPVIDAQLVVLRIWNSGKVPISSHDFERPITFSFGDKAVILNATILEAKPKILKDEATLEKDLNKIILRPLLLNRNDSIKLKVLLSNFKADIQVSARVNGINRILPPAERPIRKRIRKVDQFFNRSSILLICSLISLMLVFVIFTILNYYLLNVNNFNDSGNIFLILNHYPPYISKIANFILLILEIIFVISVPLTLIAFLVRKVLKFMEHRLP